VYGIIRIIVIPSRRSLRGTLSRRGNVGVGSFDSAWTLASERSRFAQDDNVLGLFLLIMNDFLQTVRERVVVYDGAMGTNIQKRNPTLDDYWGKENCSEILVLSRPDIIRDIHADFFGVGCDIVETNTFGATRIVLSEFDLADRVVEINLAAVKLAKEVAQQFSTKGRPRFVAGSMGPTTKLPSLGHIRFDDMIAT
jgi:5-methyltetrahydrofolate--homocysteine methyltransferase